MDVESWRNEATHPAMLPMACQFCSLSSPRRSRPGSSSVQVDSYRLLRMAQEGDIIELHREPGASLKTSVIE
jgi:hypothetical protein